MGAAGGRGEEREGEREGGRKTGGRETGERERGRRLGGGREGRRREGKKGAPLKVEQGTKWGKLPKKSSASRLAGNFPIPPLPLVHTTHTCILRCRKTHVSRPEPARAEPRARPRLRCAATAEGARRLAASRPAGPRHLEEDHAAPRGQRPEEPLLPAVVRLEGSRDSRHLRTPPAQQRSPRSGKGEPGRALRLVRQSRAPSPGGRALPARTPARERPSGEQRRSESRDPRVCACD